MEANLPGSAAPPAPPATPPFADWGPRSALLGVVTAILLGILLGLLLAAPVLVSAGGGDDLPAGANVLSQLGLVIAFLAVPLTVARRSGSRTFREATARLGVRRFRVPTALKWTAAAIGAYLLFAILYTAVFGEPEQEDIAESFGPVWVQILLIVIAASVSEEVCFRGMLFGGLRERMPMIAAGLLSGAVFGALHAVTGLSAVPPLIVFGLIMAVVYEKTGSIVPGILLHMLNNSGALLAQ